MNRLVDFNTIVSLIAIDSSGDIIAVNAALSVLSIGVARDLEKTKIDNAVQKDHLSIGKITGN